ncbi:hypothetical protein [sulfur-oxidizing endosymbiont of Gigantopelta aegis]|uniref:hypothetical protein n=1 Tax=sulfur-oxidizing endosymbiont of Gigantopelta aegis TaxID=2794934 RepID=UPI0018DBF158|nr:hypothetical protein [sulfur-oxidizing endosymbiont of Gigantopelta aegis]
MVTTQAITSVAVAPVLQKACAKVAYDPWDKTDIRGSAQLGKEETVFGVAITKGAGADRTVMGNIDVASVKHSAHLPYEILLFQAIRPICLMVNSELQ